MSEKVCSDLVVVPGKAVNEIVVKRLPIDIGIISPLYISVERPYAQIDSQNFAQSPSEIFPGMKRNGKRIRDCPRLRLRRNGRLKAENQSQQQYPEQIPHNESLKIRAQK
jgi:hypothetical protein